MRNKFLMKYFPAQTIFPKIALAKASVTSMLLHLVDTLQPSAPLTLPITQHFHSQYMSLGFRTQRLPHPLPTSWVTASLLHWGFLLLYLAFLFGVSQGMGLFPPH